MPPLPRWVLPASFALNLFLAGMVASRLLAPDFPPPPPPPPERMVAEIAATLPAADGAILRQVFAAHAAALEEGHRQRHRTPERVRAVLAADPFDAAALRAAFAEGRAAFTAQDRALEAAIVDAAEKMSTDGRHRLAEWAPPRSPRPPRR
ncbi:MAG: periplasmic heavy metal sensor [Magnetospirillum sp.]|nr:periplasmic heavy metal sensor [Magnetospirillum sp.]